MSIQAGSDNGDFAEVTADINTTPLIDIMLVLLIMLILTVPVLTHAVRLDMPAAAPATPPPAIVRVDVAADGTVIWDGQMVTSAAELERRFRAVAAMVPQPEIHLRPDGKVRYGPVAAVMAAAQRQRIIKFGIVGNERFAAGTSRG